MGVKEAIKALNDASAKQGVEILDGAISTTSSVTTHKLDKKHVQVDVYEDEDGESNKITSVTMKRGDNNGDLENAPALPDETIEELAYDDGHLPPMAHVAHSNSDDVSSLHMSLVVEEDKSTHNKQSPQPQALPVHYEEDSIDEEYRQKAIQRRNILIILLLLIFLGLVCAIGAGIVIALKDKPPKAEDKYGGLGGGVDTDDLFATAFPSSAPSYEGPCIGVEVGIIFDKYAMETSWMLLAGETEEVMWKSDYYGANWNNDWEVFKKCFPPGMYTFVFMDKEGDGICCNHGEGKYVLSSEGKVIAVGGQEDFKEERTTFELEYVAPEPSDLDGDGLDDRLGLMMPYDSSNFIEGETCENLRLVFETDQYGIETSWELYEGSTRESESLIANGGPFGSEETYVYNYCLASQKSYALYMYDWKGDGLCCEYGRGWYKLTSRNIVIHESNGKFGAVDVTRFVLPADGTLIETDAPISTPAPSQRPTPLPTPPPLTQSPTQSPKQRPTLNPITSSPTTTVAPTPLLTLRTSLSPTMTNAPTPPQTVRPTLPSFTLPFLTSPPSEAPSSQDTSTMPTEGFTTISTESESQMPTESATLIPTTAPTLQPSKISTAPPTLKATRFNVCPFCVGVEMRNPDQALAAGQTCQTVQDKANTLAADHPNCGLLQLVEQSCCGQPI